MLTAAFVAAVAVVAFLAVEVGPLVAADRFRDLREPTDAERGRFAFLREEAGLNIDRIAIERSSGAISEGDTATTDATDSTATNSVDHGDREPVDVAVRGPPRRQVLFVTESLLDEVDEDIAIGLLAAEAGRVETRYTEFRAVAVAAVLAVLAAIVTAAVPFDTGFASLIAIGLSAFWVGRRVQYAADSRAADAVGANRVADAFERAAELRGVEPAIGDWSTWFAVQPPLGDRIERLREQVS
ncbi:M48 family metallopeptidase [Halorubrum laminariae]|uniref:M48 family metallopeptidase n=1 Tax=Halorubrum laminariae TaxID=1433523 RepID=A0ABD6C0K6_9EURY|nr:M48 family metallopeptidase [Halorubrum laminariae]